MTPVETTLDKAIEVLVLETDPPAPGRIRKSSWYVREFLEGESNGGIARGKSRIPKGVQLPTGMTATSDEPDDPFAALTSPTEITFDDNPKTLKEAMERSDWPEWSKAIDNELALMAKYHVWDMVDEPAGKNIVGCHWVFRIKHNADGKILKYKARLVAQGFTQVYCIDFLDTFAPIACLSAIRCRVRGF